MPIVDGKYVAPTWINKQAPAINASELNAISQTLASLDNVQGKYYLAFGSYTGTGGEGSSSETTINLPGKAVALAISPGTQMGTNWLIGNFMWVADGAYSPAVVYGTTSSDIYVLFATITWGANSVSFYTTGTSTTHPGALQMNQSGVTYYYMAVIEA